MVRFLERPIALVGLMGAGKTSVAQRLGEHFGVAVADLDALVEADAGVSVRELFEREGEPAFRRRERRALAQALDAGARVLACGGGLVLDPDARLALRDHCHVVWLEVSPEQAALRLANGEAALRPLLRGAAVAERLSELLQARAPHYKEVAHARVATDGRTSDEVVAAVLEALPGGSA